MGRAVPESWHPEKLFEGLDLDSVSDSALCVQKIFDAFMEEWKNALANEKMDGQLIKIPGFIAPLDWADETELKEFLLVPYFGACIHLPPPPPIKLFTSSWRSLSKDCGQWMQSGPMGLFPLKKMTLEAWALPGTV